MSSTKTYLLKHYTTNQFLTLPPSKLLKLYNQTQLYVQSSAKTSPLEQQSILELYFHLSILTGHDIEAKSALHRLKDSLPETSKSEKVAVLESIYLESVSTKSRVDTIKDIDDYLTKVQNLISNDLNSKALNSLTNTNDSIVSRPLDFRIIEKRKVAVYKYYLKDSKPPQPEIYINKLLEFLKVNPMDVSTWIELDQSYRSLGELNKSYDCLMEIAVIQPFNYKNWLNLANLEIEIFISGGLTSFNYLNDAVLHYLRSIELCEMLIDSWIGLTVALKLVPDEFVRSEKSSGGNSKFKPLEDLREKREDLLDVSVKKLKQFVELGLIHDDKVLDDVNKLIN